MNETALFQQILQGATRKILLGEAPFKPLTEPDPFVEEFKDDFTEAAPLFDVDFDRTVASVIHAEILQDL